MRKYSVWSIFLIVIGTFLTLVPFTSISGALQNLFVLLLGLVCLIVSFALLTLSFLKKETGVLKFIPFVLIIPILYFIFNFYKIMGGV